MFAQAPRAFAAVRAVRGRTKWEAPAPHDSAKGAWLTCTDEFTPIILEAVPKSNVSDFATFRRTICANPLVVRTSALRYASRHYASELRLPMDWPRPPQVNGKPLDYRPAKVFDSPFIESDWNSGVVILKKGRRKLVLDFNTGAQP